VATKRTSGGAAATTAWTDMTVAKIRVAASILKITLHAMRVSVAVITVGVEDVDGTFSRSVF
jgi:hypothetical protein